MTFLFTDIEGSTRLWEEHPTAMRAALERHDQILRSAIEAHGGYVFSTGGDGFGASFQRASDAVAAAAAAQDGLAAEDGPEATRLLVRMGLHTGEAHERGGDYFGPALNVAARVMSAGRGGQVLATDTARLLVTGPTFSDLGEHRLRGVSDLVRIWQVGTVDFGALRISGEAGNLPLPASSFVGRRHELVRLEAEVRGGRTVTLLGVGGVGKTRLAIEAAAGLGDEFGDGVWFCELAPVGDPSSVVDTVAAVLGVRQQPAMSMVDSIVDSVRGRRILLVLDNCEHVLAPASELASSLNTGASTVAVLATSREPLGIPGEQVWPVPALDAAAELFVTRAREADALFMPSDGDFVVIDGICGQLDGIPLAIELAAARVRSMTVTDIATRLEDRFRLLRGSGRGGVERHQTLAATMQWSFDLLNETERLLFMRLCVFSGGFDTNAVETVCIDGETIDDFDVVDLLASLIDKSMVTADRSGSTTRYSLLETFRQFGEQLLGHDRLVELKERHLDHYVDRALAAPWLWDLGYQGGDRTLAAEWDNIRAAMGWALATGDGVRAGQLIRPAYGHAIVHLLSEVADWGQRLIELGDAPPDAYGAVSFFHGMAGDFDEQLRVGRIGLERFEWAVTPEMATLWGPYSTALRFVGDQEEANSATRSAYQAFGQLGPASQAYWAAILALGLTRSHPAEASERAAESEQLVHAGGIHPFLAGSTLTFLSLFHAVNGNLPVAVRHGEA
ncbi:MAG: adenylate/guanylate cyclase domain-containing protein, partial [Acidimicrobiia bacterium]|nr:adenylate/guanylate cyclase domain-containing protein [Acidimicrobiia bacterium]